MKILEGTDAPVIPVYLDGLWGSIFSFKGEKFFWKWPERLPYPMSIHFGRPIARARRRLTRFARPCSSSAPTPPSKPRKTMLTVTRSFIRHCKARKRRRKDRRLDWEPT